jgi:intracellular septation protein A
VRTALEFIGKNFLPPIVFYATFRMAGAKAAIAFAVLTVALQTAVMWLKRIPHSPFFIVSSSFTILFGGLDLVVRTPQYFRLEPGAQSIAIGLILLVTAFTRVTLLEWFTTGLPPRFRPAPGEIDRAYYRGFTLVLSAYFFLKAAIYLYLAFQVDLGSLILFRSVFGAVSLALLVLGELLWRRKLRRKVRERRTARSAR